MAHNEFKERPKELVEEITEEQFLKDLYLFMKKRDTPIERIPHLGFKQSKYYLFQISAHLDSQFKDVLIHNFLMWGKIMYEHFRKYNYKIFSLEILFLFQK